MGASSPPSPPPPLSGFGLAERRRSRDYGEIDAKLRNLSPELAAQLTPRARDALGHPLRRQILRTLNESDGPRSPSEIAATTLPQASVSVISYHAQVLEGCGSVTISGTRPVRAGIARLYASTVADDKQIVSALQATRQLDRWDRERW